MERVAERSLQKSTVALGKRAGINSPFDEDCFQPQSLSCGDCECSQQLDDGFGTDPMILQCLCSW